MRRVLVTGVTGFAGSHLVDYMLERGDCEIIGIQRWRSRTENIEHFMNRITMLECDLRDATSTRDTLERARPDWIFHLAAQSFVPTSWIAPTESLTTNVLAQVNLFEAVRHLGLKCRIQLACSSEEYGQVHENEVPIRETNPLRPLSPYAVSKVTQDLLGYQYWMSWKLDSVRTRGFNHEGPRRGPVFVASDFAKQIADIERGRKPPILSVGNLEARRDFTDVRHGARLLAGSREVRAGGGVQHRQREGVEHPRGSRHAARHDQNEDRGAPGSGPAPSQRRPGADRRQHQVRAPDGVEAHDPVRADAARHAGVLARAVRGRRPPRPPDAPPGALR
jgi:GDP-4-dehydro-6-deoxy-D-mannose reductase